MVRQMMDRLAHRGPDASGVHIQPDVGVLGHRRLSIMDPEGGDQPIYNEDRTHAIVANGEVYNFPELRARLLPRHTFRTGNDSEAVLHLVEDQGVDAAAALDGMFAFAATTGRGLMLARDPIGIKPLYYGRRRQPGGHASTVFASEIKALVGHVDEMAEFPPGSVYTTAEGFSTFYEVPHLRPTPDPVDEHVARVRRTLEAAVGKRLMSDVPVGAFLSGGLDSSIIAALIRPQVEDLHTFSVGTPGSRDLEAARLVARHLGTIHHEYTITAEEVLEKLPQIIYHLESFDQDLVRSAIPCFFCSRLAADYVKVILTGEGADELFAGYAYYDGIPDAEVLHRELHRSVASLHNINLQRVDRLTMAHGLEGRVPFLDLTMIELGQTIPPELKLHDDGGGRRVEKWILRRAVQDLLPAEIVWRDKEQFDEGSGTVDLLQAVMRTATAGIQLDAYRSRFPQEDLRTVEECFYHKIFHEVFEQPHLLAGHVARWAQRDL